MLQPNHLLCEFSECQDDVLAKLLGFRFWLIKTSWSLLVFHKAVSLFHASSIDVIRAFKTEICWSDLLLNCHHSSNSVAGKAALEKADLEPALKVLKDRLMTKNVVCIKNNQLLLPREEFMSCTICRSLFPSHPYAESCS